MPVRGANSKSFVSALGEGLQTPLEGFAYLNRNPGLWRFAIIPILVNLAITLSLLAALIYAAFALDHWLDAHLPAGMIGSALKFLAILLLIVVALAISVGAWLLLGGVLCGYFYGLLAMRIELALGTPRHELEELSIYYQTVDVLRDFAALTAVNLGYLLLGFVPVVGPPVALVGSTYFNCFIFGVEYLDFPLALRGMRRREKWQFARAHRGHTLGLGAIVLLLNFIPVLGSVLLASAAVGSVLLYRRISPSASLSPTAPA